MNVEDFKDIELPEGSLFSHMFEKQLALAIKYSPIETKNGFYHPPCGQGVALPAIDDARFQGFIKDMFWRTTEELCEAFEEVPEWGNLMANWDKDFRVRHFLEEIADSLHFFIEVSMYVGVSPKEVELIWFGAGREQNKDGYKIARDNGNVKLLAFNFILMLGLTANTLKNKPWKNTQMKTDLVEFRKRIIGAWAQFAYFWQFLGLDLPQLFQLYNRKNQVNSFRIRSNY